MSASSRGLSQQKGWRKGGRELAQLELHVVFLMVNGPGSSLKLNCGAQHPGRPRPIKLWGSVVDRSKGRGALMS